MVPGASAPPIRESKTCSVPLGASSGTALGTTAPVSGLVAVGKFGALAVTLIVTCDEGFAGDQVPEYSPWLGFAKGRASGGSPLENVATTCPLFTSEPQSSNNRTASGVGHPAGAKKLCTRPVCAGTSLLGAHPLARGAAFDDSAGTALAPPVPPVLETIKVTFTVRTAVAESE